MLKNRNLLLLTGGFLVVFGLGMLILTVAVGFTGWLRRGQPSGSASSSGVIKIGQTAADFVIVTLGGGKSKLSDYRGHPVLINFWATWCPPCVAEMPAIQQVYAQNSIGLVVLAVNAGDTESQVQAFMDKHALTFTIALDESGEAQRLYRILALPTSIFVDAEGTIQAVVTGAMSDTDLQTNLKKIGFNP